MHGTQNLKNAALADLEKVIAEAVSRLVGADLVCEIESLEFVQNTADTARMTLAVSSRDPFSFYMSSLSPAADEILQPQPQPQMEPPAPRT